MTAGYFMCVNKLYSSRYLMVLVVGTLEVRHSTALLTFLLAHYTVTVEFTYIC